MGAIGGAILLVLIRAILIGLILYRTILPVWNTPNVGSIGMDSFPSRAYYRKKDLDTAIEVIREAVEADSSRAFSWYNQGTFSNKEEGSAEAIEALKSAVNLETVGE
jgi:hypothetical protein